MANKDKSEAATDSDEKTPESTETTEHSGTGPKDASPEHETSADAPPPVDPLDRAKTEMEEVASPWRATEDGADADPAMTDATDGSPDKPRDHEEDDGEARADRETDADPTDRTETEVEAATPEEQRAAAESASATSAEHETEVAAREEAAAEERSERSTSHDRPSPLPAAAPPQVVRGSIWPGFFGGVIAALVGFIVGRGDVLDAYLPASLQRQSVDTSAIEAQAAEFAARAEELAAVSAEQSARIDALEAADVSSVLASVAETETRLTASLSEITERIAALESRPEASAPAAPTVSPDAVDALESTLEAQQAELAAQSAELAELSQRAAEAEARAAGEAARLLARAALLRVQTAVDTGATFAPELSELEAVAPVTVPEPLREVAGSGVPTMASLRDSFPDAARAGLAAARAEVPQSEVDGIAGFVRRQFNVRSTTPREGSDPDAVLSRAEAALRADDLGTALGELEALPEAARTAMNDWLEAASARKAAQDAAADLADSLNSN